MKSFYAFLLFMVLSGPVLVWAQAGSPDAEFGINGLITKSCFSNAHAVGNSVLVQMDGKILVTGVSWVPNTNSLGVLLRYLPDGQPDSSFNQTGIIFIQVADVYAYTHASIQQPDGKLVTLVTLSGLTQDSMALFRFMPDGHPDISFGINGVATLNLGSIYQYPECLAIQSDGKIIVGGTTENPNENFDRFFVARFNPNGSPDNTFDGDGKVFTMAGEGYANVSSVLIQPDGKIIASGYGTFNGMENIAVVRYMPDGALDPSFDGDGLAKASFGNGDAESYGAALQPDGKIIFAGYFLPAGGKSDFAAARFTTDGALDHSFHGDGLLTFPVNSKSNGARSIFLQPDGKIILGGYSYPIVGDASDMTLVRLESNGLTDFSFDEDGIVVFPASPVSSDEIYGIAMQQDGKIVVTGYERIGNFNQIVIARLLSGLTIVTSIAEAQDWVCSLYPNPASENITIDYHLDEKETIAICLLDMHGRILQSLSPPTVQEIGNHHETYSLNRNLAPGAYVVSCSTPKSIRTFPILLN